MRASPPTMLNLKVSIPSPLGKGDRACAVDEVYIVHFRLNTDIYRYFTATSSVKNQRFLPPSPKGKVILKLLTFIAYGDRGQTFRTLHLCIVAVGVFALPVPRVPAHIGKALFGLPAEDLSALSGICIAGGNVAGATVYDLVGEL